jgi:transcriptional regulator with XRE-family HTH domain
MALSGARYTYTAGMPMERVGWLIARARRTAGLGERELGTTVGVSQRTLRRWERGAVLPTDDEVEAIALACGLRVADLLPRRGVVELDAAARSMKVGDSIAALPEGATNGEILELFVALVRTERRAPDARELRLRQEDLDVLADALDLDDRDLEAQLVEIIGLTRAQASSVRSQLLRRRLVMPVAGALLGLGVVGGVQFLRSNKNPEVTTVAAVPATSVLANRAPSTTIAQAGPISVALGPTIGTSETLAPAASAPDGTTAPTTPTSAAPAVEVSASVAPATTAHHKPKPKPAPTTTIPVQIAEPTTVVNSAAPAPPPPPAPPAVTTATTLATTTPTTVPSVPTSPPGTDPGSGSSSSTSAASSTTTAPPTTAPLVTTEVPSTAAPTTSSTIEPGPPPPSSEMRA